MMRQFFPALVIFCLLCMAACVRQPAAVNSTPSTTSEAKTIRAIITGIEQFDGGHVMGLNTAHGMFVIGPQISYAEKQHIHEALLAAQDRVVTIRYVDKPQSANTIAHKLVTGLVIKEQEFHFSE